MLAGPRGHRSLYMLCDVPWYFAGSDAGRERAGYCFEPAIAPTVASEKEHSVSTDVGRARIR